MTGHVRGRSGAKHDARRFVGTRQLIRFRLHRNTGELPRIREKSALKLEFRLPVDVYPDQEVVRGSNICNVLKRVAGVDINVISTNALC